MDRRLEKPDGTRADAAGDMGEISALAAGFGVTLVGRIVGRGVQLVVEIVLARVLGPLAFGLYAIGWISLRLLGLVAVLGLDQGVLRFASPYWNEDRGQAWRIMVRSQAMSLLSGLLVGGVAYAAAPWLAGQVFSKPELEPVLRGFAWAFPLFTVLRVAAAATRVSRRLQFSVLSEEVGQPLVHLLLLAAVFMAGWRLMGAVAALVASFAAALVIALVSLWKLVGGASGPNLHANRQPMRGLLAFSVPASMAGILTLLVMSMDRFIIAHFRPVNELGIYQAVSQVPTLFAVIIGSISSIMIPMIGDLHQHGEMERLERLYRVSTRWALYASAPLFLVVCLAPVELIDCLFGTRYVSGWAVLIILGGGQMVNAATGVCGALVVMTGHQNRWMLVAGGVLLASVALNVLLVPRWGIAGAATGTALAISALYVWGLFEVRRVLRMWPYDRQFLIAVFAMAVGAGCLGLLRAVLDAPPTLFVLVAVALSVGSFFGTVLFFGLGREDREFLYVMRRGARRAIPVTAEAPGPP